MNKFSDGWTTEGRQYYKEILGEMKKMFARKGDETNFWEELRSEWWTYVKDNKLTMYEKVNDVEGETNKGEVNENQTIDCDIEDEDDSLEMNY